MRHFKALRPRKTLKCRMRTFCDLEKRENAAFWDFATSQNAKMPHENTLRGRKALKCRMKT